MKELFQFAPGSNAQSVSLSNAAPIRGIQIDNPTGGWLYVVSEKVYVPPYTIGWSLPLSYDQTSVNVNYGNGPAGQVGTNQGDNWTIILFNEEVDQSAGAQYQFTSGFASTIALTGNQYDLIASNSYSISNQIIIPAIAGTRIRLHSLFISRIVRSAGWRPPLSFIFTSSGTNNILPLGSSITLDSYETWKFFQFRPGQADLKTGGNFNLFFVANFEGGTPLFMPAMQITINTEYERI